MLNVFLFEKSFFYTIHVPVQSTGSIEIEIAFIRPKCGRLNIEQI